MRIVILGGTGQLGKLIVDQAPANWQITVTGRRESPSCSLPLHVNYLRFDPFSDNWQKLGPYDQVVNAIGAVQETGKMTFEKVHTHLTKRILDHRQVLGNPRIMQLSALGASIDHPVEFLRTKGLADSILQNELHTVVIRPSIVCTNDTVLVQKLKKLREFSNLTLGKLLLPKGFKDTRIQPILGKDLATALVKVLENKQLVGTISLVGPEEITLAHLVRLLWQEKSAPRILEVSREMTDAFVKHILNVWMPNVISYDQFQLLFRDNIAPVKQTVRLLGTLPSDTLSFWEQSLGSRAAISGR